MPKQLTQAQWAEFVRVWQSSATAEDAARELGLDVRTASSRASLLRSKGVDLKRMPVRGKSFEVDFAALGQLAKETRVDVPRRPRGGFCGCGAPKAEGRGKCVECILEGRP